MAIVASHHLALTFGLLGNVVSFMVYLAPLPTFYRIFKKKSTEGFQSIPYSVALFSAMLVLYYGFLKTENGFMLITINSIGIVIESSYLLMYLIYAPKSARIYTLKLIVFLNIGLYGAITLSTYFLCKPPHRVSVVGWVCAIFSVCVFAAPLSIMRLVIKTKSVEYMPLPLSFFLTLCAVMWFFYGFMIHDFFVALPNVLGFLFGITQMLMYGWYRNSGKKVLPEIKIVQGFPNGALVELSPAEEKPSNIDDTVVVTVAAEEKPNIIEDTVVMTVIDGGGKVVVVVENDNSPV